MRALTVKQPWASLIMAGVKDVENRSWSVPKTLPQWRRCPACGVILDPDTPDGYHDPLRASCRYVFGGPFPFRLAIHAGGGYDVPAWRKHGHLGSCPDATEAPASVLLGTVLVTGCHHADDCEYEHGDTAAYSYCSRWAQGGDNLYHWTLQNPQLLPEPIPMKGRQGLWTPPDNVAVPA